MPRLILALSIMCLLGLGTGAVAAQSSSPDLAPPGPPYPDPVDGVAVYDRAEVLLDDTIASLEAAIHAIEERTGAGVVVYLQVKPESDTAEEVQADAALLIGQWAIGRASIGDDLVIFFDLTPDGCHGQVQLYADEGYWPVNLSTEARQAIFEQDMLPLLRDCDTDGALLAAMRAIDAATDRNGPAADGSMPPPSGSSSPTAAATSVPMPFEEYVAALEASAANDPTAGLRSTSTTAEVVTALEASVALAIADQARISTIVPEPCYAEAHDAVYAYREAAIELFQDILPELAAAASVPDMVPTLEAMDAELYARYPVAFIEAPDSAAGFQGSSQNILAALASCGAAAVSEP